MNTILSIATLVIGAGYLTVLLWDRFKSSLLSAEVEDPSPQGHSIEVDCRLCGQLNRVPGHRLREKPKCGRCKARLLPKNRVCVVHTQKLEGRLKVELNRHWTDADRFWNAVADHVTLDAKERAEIKDPSRRVVN